MSSFKRPSSARLPNQHINAGHIESGGDPTARQKTQMDGVRARIMQIQFGGQQLEYNKRGEEGAKGGMGNGRGG